MLMLVQKNWNTVFSWTFGRPISVYICFWKVSDEEYVCMCVHTHTWNSKHDDLEKNDLNKSFMWTWFFRVGFCCNSTKPLRNEQDKHGERHPHSVTAAQSLQQGDGRLLTSRGSAVTLQARPLLQERLSAGAGCKADRVASAPLQPSSPDTNLADCWTAYQGHAVNQLGYNTRVLCTEGEEGRGRSQPTHPSSFEE